MTCCEPLTELIEQLIINLCNFYSIKLLKQFVIKVHTFFIIDQFVYFKSLAYGKKVLGNIRSERGENDPRGFESLKRVQISRHYMAK